MRAHSGIVKCAAVVAALGFGSLVGIPVAGASIVPVRATTPTTVPTTAPSPAAAALAAAIAKSETAKSFVLVGVYKTNRLTLTYQAPNTVKTETVDTSGKAAPEELLYFKSLEYTKDPKKRGKYVQSTASGSVQDNVHALFGFTAGVTGITRTGDNFTFRTTQPAGKGRASITSNGYLASFSLPVSSTASAGSETFSFSEYNSAPAVKLPTASSVETTTTTTTPPPAAATNAGPAAPAGVSCPKLDGSSPHYERFSKYPPICISASKSYTATVVTDVGTIKIRLLAGAAPEAVNNFVFLAGYHYFDGLKFHRVVTGFVDQTGDPTGTGSGGPGYEFKDELPKSNKSYTTGAVAMANSGANTNGSQFFFVMSDAAGQELQPAYSLFGYVTSGLKVLQKINADGSASSAGIPKVVHRMIKVTITAAG